MVVWPAVVLLVIGAGSYLKLVFDVSSVKQGVDDLRGIRMQIARDNDRFNAAIRLPQDPTESA